MVRPLGMVFCFLLACASSPRDAPPSTNTTSSAFRTRGEKVAFLERYVTFRRPYEELEYGVFFQSSAGCLAPGPGDLDLSIVARVPPSTLSAWTQGMKRVASQPPELAGLASQIDTRGMSEWYEATGKVLGIDRARAIVAYRATVR